MTDPTQEIQCGSTPLSRPHTYMTLESIIQLGPRECGDIIGSPIDDTVDSFSRSSHAIRKGKVPCTFLVNEEGIPNKTPIIPGIF